MSLNFNRNLWKQHSRPSKNVAEVLGSNFAIVWGCRFHQSICFKSEIEQFHEKNSTEGLWIALRLKKWRNDFTKIKWGKLPWTFSRKNSSDEDSETGTLDGVELEKSGETISRKKGVRKITLNDFTKKFNSRGGFRNRDFGYRWVWQKSGKTDYT